MLERADQQVFDQMSSLIASRSGFDAVVIKDAQDQIGVVTVHDGPALGAEEIIAPEVGTDQSTAGTFHNSFQDPEKFITAGGRRGRQLQVLVEGSYYINRLFATVEMVAKTVIEVGHVGVVISYTGRIPATPRARTIATANSSHADRAGSGANRCCPANMPSTPMRARS
jgi:uncharacterized membrane protein YqiK